MFSSGHFSTVLGVSYRLFQYVVARCQTQPLATVIMVLLFALLHLGICMRMSFIVPPGVLGAFEALGAHVGSSRAGSSYTCGRHWSPSSKVCVYGECMRTKCTRNPSLTGPQSPMVRAPLSTSTAIQSIRQRRKKGIGWSCRQQQYLYRCRPVASLLY